MVSAAKFNPQIATDGVVTLVAPGRGDAQLLVEGRDDEFFCWLGPGVEVPRPVACVWVGDELVGWVDYDLDHDWLRPGQVNVGYYLFPAARRRGYASRAVELLLLHLKRDTEHTVASLLIDPGNVRSLALARPPRIHRDGRGRRTALLHPRTLIRPCCTWGAASACAPPSYASRARSTERTRLVGSHGNPQLRL